VAGRRKPRGKLFIWFERVVLGAGMSIVVFFSERFLKRLIAKGQGTELKAPRTTDGDAMIPGGLSAAPHEVEQQA
jgi:hypothetical protein